MRVECAAGQTIARALQRGDERKPLTVVISGTCNESVTIDRDDQTSAKTPSADVFTVRVTPR